MAFSGDINESQSSRTPALKLDNDIFVTKSGRVSSEETEFKIDGVLKAINCEKSVDEVIDLIGFPNNHIRHLTIDGIIHSTEEVKSELKRMPERPPNSFLLQKADELYGVIIDSKNEPKVVGIIDSVVPDICCDTTESIKPNNTVVIGKTGTMNCLNSREIDLCRLISSGALFGIVGFNGFVFLEPEQSVDKQLSKLVLVLNKGYFVVENANIDWVRLKINQKIEKFESIVTKLEVNDCIVSNRGCCVRNGEGYELFGSGNSIVDFETLKNVVKSMTKRDTHSQTDCETVIGLDIESEEQFSSQNMPKSSESELQKSCTVSEAVEQSEDILELEDEHIEESDEDLSSDIYE